MLGRRHKPTILAFLNIRVGYDSLDGTVHWDFLLRKGVSDMLITSLKALYANSSGKMRTYHLSPLFIFSNRVIQDGPF